MKNKLFLAIYNDDIKKVDDFINQGIDINIQDTLTCYTPLIYASSNGYKEIVKLFLKQPNIDITIKDSDGDFFMVYLKVNSFLIDYKLQQTILNNQRDDIILFLNKYNLTHPNIKKENPDLFKANVWGLV
jgi:ankyrin repeat protein